MNGFRIVARGARVEEGEERQKGKGARGQGKHTLILRRRSANRTKSLRNQRWCFVMFSRTRRGRRRLSFEILSRISMYKQRSSLACVKLRGEGQERTKTPREKDRETMSQEEGARKGAIHTEAPEVLSTSCLL